MSIKPVTEEILGKRITGVIVKRGIELWTRPVCQFFLLFDDETYFELYSSEDLINTGGSLPEGDFDFVKRYGAEAHHVIFEAKGPGEMNKGPLPVSADRQPDLFDLVDHEEEPESDFGFSDLQWLQEEAKKDAWPVDWYDLSVFFKGYATIWDGHHEFEWFAEAWGAVLKYSPEDCWENSAEGFFMASALVMMYYGFCERLDEAYELDYLNFMQAANISIGALVRALPEDFEQVPIGKVSEKAYDILVDQIVGARGLVYSALFEHWGSIDRLFISLWNANRAPYERESWDDVMNLGISADKMVAYSYVEEKMYW